MADDTTSDNPLLTNYRARPFWNPTYIAPHEVGQPMLRMDLNECPYPPSQHVLNAICEAAHDLNRYPDGTCPRLTAQLAARTGLGVEQICYGSGSTQLLSAVADIAVAPGDQLLTHELIWRRFGGIFQAVAADLVAVPNHRDGAIDVDGLLRAVGNKTRLMIVLTPNNPTGMMLDETALRRLAQQTPASTLLFIDEAYHEFALHAGGPDAVAVLQAARRGPWAVTRTFSKAYALAGLRLGYALCSSEEIANALRLMTSAFNVNGVAEAAVLAALEDAEYTQMILDHNARERERLIDGLRAMGLAPMPSVTNFVGVDVRRNAGDVVAAMRERGVRIATFGYEAAGTCVRMSTGLPADTDVCLETLATVLAELPSTNG